MEIEDYNYEKNSNTISKEERDAFIDRFKRACTIFENTRQI